MKIHKSFKFRLEPTKKQTGLMRQFAGCCRYVWNRALELEENSYTACKKHLGYNFLAGLLKEWKREEDSKFLAIASAHILQQTLMDLEKAYKKFYAGHTGLPNFKKKGDRNSFRYPRDFKIEEGNRRIYLPKIGWVKYRKSRNIEGTARQVTVLLSSGCWYIAIHTELEIPDPAHPSRSEIGIDMGVVRFATLSDGTFISPPDTGKYDAKVKKLQRRQSKQKKFSANWRKTKAKIQRIYQKISNIRRDLRHKSSTSISKSHAIVVMENLQVTNMTASASGTIENPGKNIRAKSGLNRSIRARGWYAFKTMLEYKLHWRGGKLVLVPPQYTSQKCSRCGHTEKENRKTQSAFHCLACGFDANADHNAAINILAAGRAVTACGAGGQQAPAVKQEPACGAV